MYFELFLCKWKRLRQKDKATNTIQPSGFKAVTQLSEVVLIQANAFYREVFQAPRVAAVNFFF